MSTTRGERKNKRHPAADRIPSISPLIHSPHVFPSFLLTTLQRLSDVKAFSEDDSDVVGRVDDQLQRRSDDVCGFLLEEDLRLVCNCQGSLQYPRV